MPKKSVKKSAKKTVKKSVKKVTRKAGVGRPKGSGKYGCPTKLIRVPAHLVQEVLDFALQKNKANSK
ncbi:MAG: DUF2281 domain-containing protein [Planctomycetaceae bacterium]|jgi:hypothetical protein|nr:DUF2281 domain-containing protein [Planctomycetaceae bacterium]